jgi:hypothetical protein
VAVTGGSLCALVLDGIGSRGGSAGLHNTPTSEHEVPPLAQVLILSRGIGPLSFRGRRVARCYGLAALGKRQLCKGCPRLLPFHTAPVVRCGCPHRCSTEVRWTGWAVTRDVSPLTRRTEERDQFHCVWPKR